MAGARGVSDEARAARTVRRSARRAGTWRPSPRAARSGACRIHSLPFRVGRRHGLELVLPADSVSKMHAEIYALGPGLRLRDLGSKNGTFLNRALVEDAALGEGDVLHFADFEFRLGRSDVEDQVAVAAPDERPTTVR